LTENITERSQSSPKAIYFFQRTDSDFIVKLIDVFPDDYHIPEPETNLPNGQQKESAGRRINRIDTLANGYEMLLRRRAMRRDFATA